MLAGTDERVNGWPTSQFQKCGARGVKLVTTVSVEIVPLFKKFTVHSHRIICADMYTNNDKEYIDVEL